MGRINGNDRSPVVITGCSCLWPIVAAPSHTDRAFVPRTCRLKNRVNRATRDTREGLCGQLLLIGWNGGENLTSAEYLKLLFHLKYFRKGGSGVGVRCTNVATYIEKIQRDASCLEAKFPEVGFTGYVAFAWFSLPSWIRTILVT